jgi:hypothetical protein
MQTSTRQVPFPLGRLRAVAACIVATLAVTMAVGAGQDKSVNDGVYTEAQAERGKSTFERTCTSCHDTVRFTGAEFVQTWSDKPLADLFEVMRTTMPEDNPGSLKPQQYADILSYVLKLNGFGAGETELTGTALAMKAIRMESRK